MICIAENSGGKGGVAGGAGSSGQASQGAQGFGAHGYGYPVIEATTGMTVTLEVQLTKDYNGEIASDLTDITKILFKARPSMASSSTEIEVECTYTPEGIVTLPLTPAELNKNNGVWYAEFLCYNDDLLVQVYKAYLSILNGMDGTGRAHNTISIMDVRMALMDTSPEANQLLDDLEFSDGLILNAVSRAVNEWNETPPSLAQNFTMKSFPYKEHLIKGATGFLLEAITYRYMRNRMHYSAAGLSLDTSDKGKEYQQMAAMARQEWRNFVALKKTEHNMTECFGTFSLPYFGR